MKKVFAILAAVALVSFVACKNNAKQKEEAEVDPVEQYAPADEEPEEDVVEEIVVTPSK
jgi:hypothetical protein